MAGQSEPLAPTGATHPPIWMYLDGWMDGWMDE